ncbi:MAG: GDP-L-fucose synthase [Alphaproteobacteria bacterium]|nr:GDP-L-fucose synthase [Alphaproteobacteria bacterium]
METTKYALSGKKIWVAGHRGMVGAALMRRLEKENCTLLCATQDELDLRRQDQVEGWIKKNKPDCIFLAAAKVGGIWANNTYPAAFLYDNLMMEANIIHAAYINKVEKLLFLGSSCIYPRMAAQPMKEEALLSGPLEQTNEWYALAKIAGIKMCQAYRRQYGCNFIAAMPTNLFGAGDNYDPEGGHVVASLIQKAHKAKQSGAPSMELWGTGSPLREFLYVDDLADALVFLMENYDGEPHINVGSGLEYTILQLAKTIAKTVGFEGDFLFDDSKPDGTPRKLMDSSRMHAMGWRAPTSLEDGLKVAYQWFLDHKAS